MHSSHWPEQQNSFEVIIFILLLIYLENFNKQVQPLILDEMAAGCWRFISKIPECAQSEFEGGVHCTLSRLLTHNVEQLLQGGKSVMLFTDNGERSQAGRAPHLHYEQLCSQLSRLFCGQLGEEKRGR